MIRRDKKECDKKMNWLKDLSDQTKDRAVCPAPIERESGFKLQRYLI